ncbi:helix-turn-helix domain-containing protein [Amycolatopsis sp. 195334CR]|uniref:helix-turn-helix domain-containing protein n=1 Tax=Amycolatopsis sp. 195334CR TaxID=2814588 RepID=UPI001A8D78CC|nr:helix-turn-helix transcriptional regulator [Amycolatopsis sp. 195334CR]MBN6034180.1 helix-turn-helix transcriptional regulator [Amycolatopsis sp. 195334CR]
MPADFWDHPAIRDAVGKQQFGALLRAYRKHPFHGGTPLPQASLASWLSMSQAQLSRLERGACTCGLEDAMTIARTLHLPPELHWFLPATATPEKDTAAAARESLRFTGTLAHLADRGAALRKLRADLSLAASQYVHSPLGDVVGDLVQGRDDAIALLESPLRPVAAREAYFLAGAACLMLAHAAQNAGDSRAAHDQLQAADELAEVADHDPLRAWVFGTSALIHEWTRRHNDAVDLARQGQRCAASSTTQTRLLAIEARAAARAGDRNTAARALDRMDSLDSADTEDDVTALGGLLTFPDAKRVYYLGSTHGLLGHHEQSEQHASAAITAYETGLQEERSYGDEALAWLDVVNARLALGDPDGAREALTPILTLSAPRRISQLYSALDRTRSFALQLGNRGHSAAAELGTQLSAALTTRPALPSARALSSR